LYIYFIGAVILGLIICLFSALKRIVILEYQINHLLVTIFPEETARKLIDVKFTDTNEPLKK
jgi:hypothetical protein